MDWDIFLQTTLAFLGLSGIIGWLIKSIITHYLNKDIDRAKAEIQSEYDIELEKLKSGFRIAEKGFEIQFTKMYGKRAEVFAELFRLLVRAKRAVGSYVSLFQSYIQGKEGEVMEEKGLLAYETLNEYLNYSAEVRLYLTPKIEGHVDEIERRFNKAWSYYQVKESIKNRDTSQETKLWVEADQEVNELIPPALEELKREFRIILNINEDD